MEMGSKNLKKNLKQLGDIAFLMTLMQSQEDIVSLSAKMPEDLDLFCLLFAEIRAQINEQLIRNTLYHGYWMIKF